MASKRLGLFWQCTRYFSTSYIQRSDAGEFLTRMLSNKVDSKIQKSNKVRHAVKLLDKKRILVLNKMYMRNVTQALSFGGFDVVLDKGIQITRVSVKDTTAVEVFWVAADNENPDEVQNMLTSIAGKVRDNLMYGNMMGNVPQIKFKRDLVAFHEELTRNCLQKLELQLALEEEQGDVPEIVEDNELSAPLPIMRMDTFGLPHDKIMRRIKESKSKSYPLRIPIPPTQAEFETKLAINYEAAVKSSEDQFKQKKELKKFIANYKKSALCSSGRQAHLKMDQSEYVYSTQYVEDYSDEMSVNSSDEEWQNMVRMNSAEDSRENQSSKK